MIRRNQKLLNKLNILTDVLLLFGSYLIAMYLRFEVLNGKRGVDMMESSYVIMAAAYSISVVFVYYCLGLYSARRLKKVGEDSLTIAVVNAVGVLGLMAFLYTTRLMDFPRLAVALYWFSSTTAVLVKRTALRKLLQYYRALGFNQKHVVLVGCGKLAEGYVHGLADNPQMGYSLAGYVGGAENKKIGKRLGGYEELERILESHSPDELVVALEPNETSYMKRVLAAADKEGVRISIIPFYNEYIPSRPSIDVIGDVKLINMRATPLDNLLWASLKRGMDIVGSLLLIVLSSPIMLAVAIGVKLSSPGPILFKQERVGRDKKPFMMLKFRSMRVTDSEETGWTTDDDPRKTRFGSLIRKLSLDELPQFFNVLVGDMSLVGPRPEIPFHVSHFKEEIPLYLVRQQIRPGITGWAQVNGLRGDTSIEERVKYDIWYIENWSFALDVLILLRTCFGGMVNREKMDIG